MAHPVNFSGANMRLLPPEGSENVQELATFTNGFCSVSCWKLEPDELAEIARTGRIYISIFSGRSQPPVFVGSEDSVRGVVVDFGGVWKREGGDAS